MAVTDVQGRRGRSEIRYQACCEEPGAVIPRSVPRAQDSRIEFALQVLPTAESHGHVGSHFLCCGNSASVEVAVVGLPCPCREVSELGRQSPPVAEREVYSSG